MREVRNKHAHQVEFSLAETYRVLDSAELLLRKIGADAEAQRIAARKPAVLAAWGGGATGRSLPSPPSAPFPARLPAPPTVPLPSSTEPAATSAQSTESDDAATLPLTRRQLRDQPEADPSATPAPTPSSSCASMSARAA